MSRRFKPPSFPAPLDLVVCVRLLSAVGALAVAATREADPRFLALFAGLFVGGFFIQKRPRLLRLFAVAQPVLASLVFGLALLDFLFFSQSFLLVVAHFLLSLQGVRLLSLDSNRDSLGALLLASLMILSASTLAVDWTFFLFLLFFLPIVTWALMLHNVAYEAQAAAVDRAGFGTEATPAGGTKEEWTKKQVAAHEHYRLQTDARSGFWRRLRPALRGAVGISFTVSLACCLVVFFLFPRFNLRGFRGRFLQPVRTTGFTNQVDLDGGGRIFTDNSVVMRVEINSRDRDKWTGYLKGATLDFFDGRRWKKSELRTAGRIFQTEIGQIRFFSPPPGSGALLRQSVYLESMDSPALFAAPHPVRLKIDRPFVLMSGDGALQRSYGDAWRLHYEVESLIAGSRGAGLRGSPNLLKEKPNRYETFFFHNDPSWARIQGLAESVSRGAATPRETADRIEDHLRDNYEYTLDLEKPSSSVPLDDFLFRFKKGHCEFFASAMALMLRSRGVPARVATGFLGTEWNEQGSYFVVRMKDAHAWVEAYLGDEDGWVAFDPSPRAAALDIGRPWLYTLRQAMDYMNLRWNRYVLSYDFERQLGLLRGFTQRSQQVSLGMERWLSAVRQRMQWSSAGQRPRASDGSRERFGWIIWLGMGVVAALALVVLGRRIRRRRRKSPVWFYPFLLRYLEKSAGKKALGQTFQEFLAQAQRTVPNLPPELEFLSRLYYRFRFGDPRPSPEESLAIRQALAKLK